MANVLIVDDDITTRSMLAAIVEGGGHDTAQASNGNMAVNMFRDQRPDLVIMDIAMPDKNGLLATRDLIAEFPEAKVIVISGENAEQLDYATDYGAVATMTKPIAPVDLRAAIAEALGTVEGPVFIDNTHII